MSKTDTIAIIAAILAASDDFRRQMANVEGSADPSRYVDDAVEIYDASLKRIVGAESRRRYGTA